MRICTPRLRKKNLLSVNCCRSTVARCRKAALDFSFTRHDFGRHFVTPSDCRFEGGAATSAAALLNTMSPGIGTQGGGLSLNSLSSPQRRPKTSGAPRDSNASSRRNSKQALSLRPGTSTGSLRSLGAFGVGRRTGGGGGLPSELSRIATKLLRITNREATRTVSVDLVFDKVPSLDIVGPLSVVLGTRSCVRGCCVFKFTCRAARLLWIQLF